MKKKSALHVVSPSVLKAAACSLLALGLAGGMVLPESSAPLLSPAQAATLNWNPDTTASWTDASAYAEGAAPTAGDTVLVTGGTNVMNGSVSNTGFNLEITGGSSLNSNDYYIAKKAVLTLNNPSEASGSVSFTVNSTVRVGGDTAMDGPAVLNVTAGTFLAKSWFAIGRTEKGVVNVNGGTLKTTSGSAFLFGDATNAIGELNLSAGVLDVTNPFRMGVSTNSQGTFTQTGGTATLRNAQVEVGSGTGTKGTITINGNDAVLEVLNTAKIGVGSQSTGSINLQAGTLNANNNSTNSGILVGASASATSAALTVSGGTLNAANLKVANSGLLTVSSGTANAASMTVQDSGSAIVTGGTLKVTGTATVNGTGKLTVSGGTNNTINALNLSASGSAAFSGGSSTATTTNLSGTSSLTLTGGTNTFTTLNLSDSASLTVSGGTTNTITTLVTAGSSNVLITGADTRLTANFNVRNSSVVTIDGAQVTSSGTVISNASTFNLTGGGKLTMTGTLRVGNYEDKLVTGSSVLNVIDGELVANSWIGHSFRQDYAVINLFSKGKITHKGSIFVQGDGGGTSILNFYQGGTINSVNMSSGGNRATINFIPTGSGDWNLNANTLTISDWNLTFGELDGITPVGAGTYSILLKNATGTPNVKSNDFWNVSYDTGTKILTATLKSDLFEEGAGSATFDGGESGVLKLSEIQPDENGKYSFSTALHGEGDQASLLAFLNDSLNLFNGLDPNGAFTIESETYDALTFTGSLPLPDYFAWNLTAFNLANGSNFTFTGVPEPAAIWLLLLGMGALVWVRKQNLA